MNKIFVEVCFAVLFIFHVMGFNMTIFIGYLNDILIKSRQRKLYSLLLIVYKCINVYSWCITSFSVDINHKIYIFDT